MKNTLFVLICCFSIMLLSACNKAEKLSTIPAAQQSSGSWKIITLPMTPGQMHNQLLSAYIQQYGILEDNQVTMAEVETMCGRMAQIASDQGLLTNMTATDLANDLYSEYVNSGSFVNGILRPTSELITRSINTIPNPDIRSAMNQIHSIAAQADPDFIQDATMLLDNLSGLNPQDQEIVSQFKSVLLSSYNLWTDPVTPKPSYLPTGAGEQMAWAQNIAMADAAGARRGYNDNGGALASGSWGRLQAEEGASTGAATASAAAAGRP
ncbi:hypothetical protein F0919_00300 [Taibaiella lutea]|uniref:Uncharacterized protein n=1 Tax=Taibaiella lutea TaxID=2608001 RepID=A0A5M6CMB9_9BACT|nr:hypothetical protein [Taibaiella lutea]KAA5536147.1 hypothetical protein F0919_00300 [Taibaiella lutea]